MPNRAYLTPVLAVGLSRVYWQRVRAARILPTMPHPISEQTIREVAKLARLNLTDDEARLFSSQLGDVLGAIDQLKQLDVENVKPMPHAYDQLNVFREDKETPGMPVDQALANAPDKDEPFFKVPKVLGDGGGA